MLKQRFNCWFVYKTFLFADLKEEKIVSERVRLYG